MSEKEGCAASETGGMCWERDRRDVLGAGSSEMSERQPAQRGSWGALRVKHESAGKRHDTGYCKAEAWDRLERVAVCERCTGPDHVEGMMGSAVAARAGGIHGAIGQAEGSDRLDLLERAACRVQEVPAL